MSLKNSLVYILLAFAVISCDKTRVFDEYVSVGSGWHRDTIATFALPEIDSTKAHNLFVNVRANNKYPFNNLFLIVSLDKPNGMTVVDTLEYQMTDAEGNLLGQGFSDIKESKLYYKEKYKFDGGKHQVRISHAIRESGKVKGVESLEGITEVGFRIESLE